MIRPLRVATVVSGILLSFAMQPAAAKVQDVDQSVQDLLRLFPNCTWVESADPHAKELSNPSATVIRSNCGGAGTGFTNIYAGATAKCQSPTFGTVYVENLSCIQTISKDSMSPQNCIKQIGFLVTNGNAPNLLEPAITPASGSK